MTANRHRRYVCSIDKPKAICQYEAKSGWPGAPQGQ